MPRLRSVEFLFIKNNSNATINSSFTNIFDMVMVFNTTFNKISAILWRLVLLVEETGVPGEKHWPVASHWQTLSHIVVSSTPCNFSGDSKISQEVEYLTTIQSWPWQSLSSVKIYQPIFNP